MLNQKIIDLIKKAGKKRSAKKNKPGSSGEDLEKSSDIETEEIYAGYHLSSFIPLFYSS